MKRKWQGSEESKKSKKLIIDTVDQICKRYSWLPLALLKKYAFSKNAKSKHELCSDFYLSSFNVESNKNIYRHMFRPIILNLKPEKFELLKEQERAITGLNGLNPSQKDLEDNFQEWFGDDLFADISGDSNELKREKAKAQTCRTLYRRKEGKTSSSSSCDSRIVREVINHGMEGFVYESGDVDCTQSFCQNTPCVIKKGDWNSQNIAEFANQMEKINRTGSFQSAIPRIYGVWECDQVSDYPYPAETYVMMDKIQGQNMSDYFKQVNEQLARHPENKQKIIKEVDDMIRDLITRITMLNKMGWYITDTKAENFMVDTKNRGWRIDLSSLTRLEPQKNLDAIYYNLSILLSQIPFEWLNFPSGIAYEKILRELKNQVEEKQSRLKTLNNKWQSAHEAIDLLKKLLL